MEQERLRTYGNHSRLWFDIDCPQRLPYKILSRDGRVLAVRAFNNCRLICLHRGRWRLSNIDINALLNLCNCVLIKAYYLYHCFHAYLLSQQRCWAGPHMGAEYDGDSQYARESGIWMSWRLWTTRLVEIGDWVTWGLVFAGCGHSDSVEIAFQPVPTPAHEGVSNVDYNKLSSIRRVFRRNWWQVLAKLYTWGQCSIDIVNRTYSSWDR